MGAWSSREEFACTVAMEYSPKAWDLKLVCQMRSSPLEIPVLDPPPPPKDPTPKQVSNGRLHRFSIFSNNASSLSLTGGEGDLGVGSPLHSLFNKGDTGIYRLFPSPTLFNIYIYDDIIIVE